ncbi:hypothetical protein MSAN_00800000 [Mycena sanguinolenta]|uniref:Uncharacterized protein n=1 Tax=Mycena sanguinolenta TaxID=230812 RepID=A0A8H7DAJ3_9AGAR|nr:hypothetical protein MSAN_00800000 [Mycena sanguinolenta]
MRVPMTIAARILCRWRSLGGGGRAGARLSFHGGVSPASRAPTIRGHRPRTASMTSSLNSSIQSSAAPAGSTITASTAPFNATLPDHSQTGLEKVIKARLFETFIAISVEPSLDADAVLSPQTPATSASPVIPTPPRSPKLPNANGAAPRKGVSAKPSPLSPNTDKEKTASRRDTPTTPASPSSSRHTPKSASMSMARPNGKPATGAASPATRSRFPPTPTPPTTPQIPSSAPALLNSTNGNTNLNTSNTNSPVSPVLPDYLSPIHRPSTNPVWTIDTQAEAWAGDPSGQKVRVELWGKVGDEAVATGKGKEMGKEAGKGKEKEREREKEKVVRDDEWRVLEEWKFDLGQLVPLADDTELPSNTLVATLYPPGRTFYLPSSTLNHLNRNNISDPQPSPSVDTGYASDPESTARAAAKAKAKADGEQMVQFADVAALSRTRYRHRHRGAGGAAAGEAEGGRTKTAGWQDLFKLVSFSLLAPSFFFLTSSIQDNQGSLNDIVREIDKVLEGDVTAALKREVSERESLVQGLRKNVAAVYDQSEILKEKIELRRQQLLERREMLTLAQELRNDELSGTDESEEQVSTARQVVLLPTRLLFIEIRNADYRSELISLRSRFTPTRTTLISNLSTIFPIELLSPPDLLYAILDVPLPIPLTASDPAPPLTLPAHKDVTEDAVATALGYVAQVVQLLAAYLGKGLVYPITCIGSRSMIRDGISAMVGPRMFPLFSKGVDTYRFEYGVFLLNKDIELLMADRDLRALDMRHTLPNLKNLLLTLTDGEGAQLGGPRAFDSPELALTGLESPRAESPALVVESENGSVPSFRRRGNTPPASGSTTPTTETAKKGRSFIGLSPIAGFLRARYPSAIRTPTPTAKATESEPSVAETTPAVTEEDATMEDDMDEDRRTIRGDTAGDAVIEALANGAERGSEKLGEVPAHAPTKPPPTVTPIK